MEQEHLAREGNVMVNTQCKENPFGLRMHRCEKPCVTPKWSYLHHHRTLVAPRCNGRLRSSLLGFQYHHNKALTASHYAYL